ncbi:MAG: succinate dehydrogenase assembly factor 2 [Rhodocyclaceae bacterium]|nr:succinate dehydrogenase assembly factor 2 [Rhodocyclaceae bacterium]
MSTTAADSRHARDERLRWHCRRALLELDIVFTRFWAERQGQPLDDEEAASLTRLLALEDYPLWDLVSGKNEFIPPADKKLLELLRRL